MDGLFIVGLTAYLSVGAIALVLGEAHLRSQVMEYSDKHDPSGVGGLFTALYVLSSIYAILFWPFCVKLKITKRPKK